MRPLRADKRSTRCPTPWKRGNHVLSRPRNRSDSVRLRHPQRRRGKPSLACPVVPCPAVGQTRRTSDSASTIPAGTKNSRTSSSPSSNISARARKTRENIVEELPITLEVSRLPALPSRRAVFSRGRPLGSAPLRLPPRPGLCMPQGRAVIRLLGQAPLESRDAKPKDGRGVEKGFPSRPACAKSLKSILSAGRLVAICGSGSRGTRDTSEL